MAVEERFGSNAMIGYLDGFPQIFSFALPENISTFLRVQEQTHLAFDDLFINFSRCNVVILRESDIQISLIVA